MTEVEIRNKTDEELAYGVLYSSSPSTPMELALANRLLDRIHDLKISEAEPRCECS